MNIHRTAEVNVYSAASAFGKFQKQFLSELHAEIVSHAKNEEAGLPAQPVQGITVHDSDVLEPEPLRQGGLMRHDAVSLDVVMKGRCAHIYMQKHAFRPPARPLEPPTPRTSVLGLDQLAKDKRAAAAEANGEGHRKKPRLDGSSFKGTNLSS